MYVLKNAELVNEGRRYRADLRIAGGRIQTIDESCNLSPTAGETVIDASTYLTLPGVIDDQVHFREPGLTHKANIYTESRAAVAGGITSYMEMPNTNPQTLTQELLQDKYDIAFRTSLANYSFFMGASNDNIEEVLKTDIRNVCGVKVFMGSSTGNMLVDNAQTLERIFSNSPCLVATHCEDEATIRHNMELAKAKYGEDIPVEMHPVIRDAEACYRSSSMAVELAKKHNTRLHILHISTEKELALFSNTIPLREKRITAEVCVHHLWFSDADYAEKGNFIKWNPAVKKASDREALWKALLKGTLDIVATDHAPHTLEEKQQSYMKAPSGGPLVQHALLAMLEKSRTGLISLEQLVEKMSHNPAICFQLSERGYLREGYWADIVLVDPKGNELVSKENVYYKCGWSPFEGQKFSHTIDSTFVSGHLAYRKGVFNEEKQGERLRFER